MIRPKTLEIGKKNMKTVKEPIITRKSHEYKPNLSKDRAMHEGDNPSL
jgi:hypothetical protein